MERLEHLPEITGRDFFEIKVEEMPDGTRKSYFFVQSRRVNPPPHGTVLLNNYGGADTRDVTFEEEGGDWRLSYKNGGSTTDPRGWFEVRQVPQSQVA
jgi:hypothetical protein